MLKNQACVPCATAKAKATRGRQKLWPPKTGQAGRKKPESGYPDSGL